ncbi:MAG: pseudouridine synthase [Treponema sp.]|nr:pseudouridine synthase [Treponema sp.]
MVFSGSEILENKSAQKIYLLMNKPAGYVCSAVSDSHKTVYQLLPPELQELQKSKRGEKLHTVGRLDCDTSGLLLFTTDGFFSDRLTRPENHIPKTYRAILETAVPVEQQHSIIEQFAEGVTLPAEKKAPEQFSGPAELSFISDTECEITVHQGKFHQVRRMFLAAGNKVQKLHRISEGEYLLPDNLQPGEYITLSPV